MVTKSPIPGRKPIHGIGGWDPRDRIFIRDHANNIVKGARKAQLDLVKPVQDLAELIHKNPTVHVLFTEMLVEVPIAYDEDRLLRPDIEDVPTLLDAINFQIQQPISYNDLIQIGTPINALLDWPMGTKAGFAAFLRDDVNRCFEAILAYWGTFLMSDASIQTVTTAEGGWLSAAAQTNPSSPGLKDFLNTYSVPNPDDVHYGFRSWDQFFTRKFLPGIRQIDHPQDSHVVVSAAESIPFNIQENVQLHDSFWAKDQHYSLSHLLGDPDMAAQFVGGTVYQALLSADCYHNWHAPVSGHYLQAPTIIGGTYYSEPLLLGGGLSSDLPEQNPVPSPDAAAVKSQTYMACMAKRGVAFIQPDDPTLGLVALVMIGMAEVSSIEFDELECFEKGQEIGRFHYGGSTHCLVFGPGVAFTPDGLAVPKDPEQFELEDVLVPVCRRLGTLDSVAR